MIRQLDPVEWPALQQTLIDEFAEGLPDPAETRIFAVEEEGEVVVFMQIESLAVHIRHIYAKPDYRANGAVEELVNHVRGLFRGAGKRGHLVASTPFAERLAEFAGMKKLDGVIYEGDGT